MNSKEAIEYLRNNTKFYEPVNREAFRTIEEDLETLEILKKQFKKEGLKMEKHHLVNTPIYLIVNDKKEAYFGLEEETDAELVKRWLDNEK